MAFRPTPANLLITRQNFSLTPWEEPIDLTLGLIWVSVDFSKVLSQYKDGGSDKQNCIDANWVVGNFLTILFNHMAVRPTPANLLITHQNFSFTPGEEQIDLTLGLLWVSADFSKVLSLFSRSTNNAVIGGKHGDESGEQSSD